MTRVDARLRTAKGLRVLAALVCGALYCAAQVEPPVAGQNSGTTRTIEGAVLTDKGVPVPGAIVLLKNAKTLQVRSYIAQTDGRYHFYGLSTDVNYQLRAQANGLTSKTKTVSVFDSHKVVKLNLKLVKKFKA